MTMIYNDLGKLAVSYIDSNSATATATTVMYAVSNSLQNSLIVNGSATIPKTSNGTNTLVFYTSAGPVLTYVPNSSGYPTATFKVYFNTPQNVANFPLHFTLTFFDANHVTIQSVDAPSVVGRFDATNIDAFALDVFTNAILAVALPVAMEQLCDEVYNNAPIDDH